MQKICTKYAKNMLKYAINMPLYAQNMLVYAKNMQKKNMQIHRLY